MPAVRFRVAVKSEAGEVDDALSRMRARSRMTSSTRARPPWRASEPHVVVTSALPNPPTGSGPRPSGPFNVSQRGEQGSGDGDLPGVTIPATRGKSSGGEQFNHERPARACW